MRTFEEFLNEATKGHRVGKPRKNRETGEWEVPYFVDGKRHEGKTYYTNDKGDAHDTHGLMSKEAEKINGGG